MQDFVHFGGKVSSNSGLTATTTAPLHSLMGLLSSEPVGHWAACSMLLACLQPSLMLCNQLTNAWSKTGTAGEIRAVMASMRLMGMRPDVYTWSSLVHAHAVARQTGRYTNAAAMLLLLLQMRAVVIILLLCKCKISLSTEGCFCWDVCWRGCADLQHHCRRIYQGYLIR